MSQLGQSKSEQYLTATLLVVFLAGILASDYVQASTDLLQKSFSRNLESESYADWETSGLTPHDVFDKLRAQRVSADEVCQSFGRLSVEETAFFEDEIKSNHDLVKPCAMALTTRIERYWNYQRLQLYSGEEAQLIQAHANGSTPSASYQFQVRVIERDMSGGPYYITGDVGHKEVLLTFDDGPHPSHTEAIRQALAAVNAKGIFFAMGKMAQTYPSVIRRVADDGHRIGSHSYDHSDLSRKSFDSAVWNIRTGHQAVAQAVGWIDPFFRFPYGAMTTRLRSYLKQHSVSNWFWHIDPQDWNKRATPNASTLVNRVMSDLNRKGRGVILLHDVQRVTREALPALLRELYYGGYQPVIIVPASYNNRASLIN